MQGWRGKRVHFAHVPRERNSWAHHLAAQALAWSREVELQELTSSPPLGESAPREILPLPQVEPAPVGGLWGAMRSCLGRRGVRHYGAMPALQATHTGARPPHMWPL